MRLTKNEKFLLSIIENLGMFVATMGRTFLDERNRQMYDVCEKIIIDTNSKLQRFLEGRI